MSEKHGKYQPLVNAARQLIQDAIVAGEDVMYQYPSDFNELLYALEVVGADEGIEMVNFEMYGD